ncbi:MAG: polysaccharide pyruvyl transferase family protein [Methylobacter sp.]|nr:polysaccharide pyruvyl transferase family protein [Methylobacter sp.]
MFTTANAIRPNLDPGCTAQVLELLSIDFIVVGMGMQQSLPLSTENLNPRLVDLIDVCNRKAKIFWVRGQETQTWLNAVGFENSKVLGCPGMYVYPENILNITAPNPVKVTSAVTAGYINGRIPRSTSIIGLFKDFDAHYVMQEEMFAWKMQGLIPESDQNIYNDATGEVSRDFVNGILEEIHYEKMPFSSYRWFQDPNAWRAFVSRFDFYLGDRLHGGIASLQAGIPSIMMAEDKRVSEIADFFGIPRISSKEVDLMPLREIVNDYLSSVKIDFFKAVFFDRFKELEKVFNEADISLAISLKSPKPVFLGETYDPPRKTSPSPIRHVRRLLRNL